MNWEDFGPGLLQAVAIAGYLAGSIPFGLVLTRLAGLGDIRAIGSGNIGATNVLRTGHKGLALATLLLDGGKGAAAVLIGNIWAPELGLVAGLGAVFGHLFPLWLRFKGGKGVATTLGLLLALDWRVGAIACLTWLLMAALFRFSSLAALVAIGSAPIAMYVLADGSRAAVVAFIAIMVAVRHEANITRLLSGREPKIGADKKTPQENAPVT